MEPMIFWGPTDWTRGFVGSMASSIMRALIPMGDWCGSAKKRPQTNKREVTGVTGLKTGPYWCTGWRQAKKEIFLHAEVFFT